MDEVTSVQSLVIRRRFLGRVLVLWAIAGIAFATLPSGPVSLVVTTSLLIATAVVLALGGRLIQLTVDEGSLVVRESGSERRLPLPELSAARRIRVIDDTGRMSPEVIAVPNRDASIAVPSATSIGLARGDIAHNILAISPQRLGFLREFDPDPVVAFIRAAARPAKQPKKAKTKKKASKKKKKASKKKPKRKTKRP